MSEESLQERNKRILDKRKKAYQIRQSKCKHKRRAVVCDEGFAYIFCRDCFKTWENEDI